MVRLRKNKKAQNSRKLGQMKIQQMAFMFIAVTLFFILVGLFVLVFKFSDVKKSAEELEEKNAKLLVSRLANSPEFACGESFGTSRINCVDEDKIKALQSNSNKYAGFWGREISNIEIRTIYPDNGKVLSIYSDEMSGNYIWNFVSLCRKQSSENKCELAKLFVGYK